MKKFIKIFVTAVFLIGLIAIVNQANLKPVNNLTDEKLNKYASEILNKCQSASYKPTCYETEIPNLMGQISMEDAFKVTSIVQENDKSYTYCHVLGHKLSAKEVKKDPSKWKEVVTRCPSGVCSNGCIHGGFQEKFRSESFNDQQLRAVKPDLIDICEEKNKWKPTGLEQASCYHALGHLTMYLTTADINKSTTLCEEIGIKKDGRDFSRFCFDGAFMQIYQPLEPDDFSLIAEKEVSRGDVDFFCGKFSGKKKGSCISESWPLFREEILNNPKNLEKFCSNEEKDEQKRCFIGLFYVLTAQFNFDLPKIKDYCLKISPDLSGLCFANAATRLIETDYRNISKSIEICSSSQTNENQSICFEDLMKNSTYNFHAGSKEFFELCNSLPEPWKTSCLREG